MPKKATQERILGMGSVDAQWANGVGSLDAQQWLAGETLRCPTSLLGKEPGDAKLRHTTSRPGKDLADETL